MFCFYNNESRYLIKNFFVNEFLLLHGVCVKTFWKPKLDFVKCGFNWLSTGQRELNQVKKKRLTGITSMADVATYVNTKISADGSRKTV